MINDAIQAIIKLLKLQKEAKKTDLEIEKLDRDKKEAQSLIKIASLDDITKYDPRAASLERTVTTILKPEGAECVVSPIRSPGNWIFGLLSVLIVLGLLGWMLYRAFVWLLHQFH